MSYSDIDTITFTNKDGNSFSIKDMREYPEYETAAEISLQQGDMLDEIASRREIYGDGNEGEAYRIFENNVVALFEAGFDLNKLKSLRIPD